LKVGRVDIGRSGARGDDVIMVRKRGGGGGKGKIQYVER